MAIPGRRRLVGLSCLLLIAFAASYLFIDYQVPRSTQRAVLYPLFNTFQEAHSNFRDYVMYQMQQDTQTSATDETLAIDDSVAVSLSKSIRLACFITTREKNWHTKLKAVNETWGRRCDKMLYVMTSNITAPDVLSVSIPDDRGTLTEKIRTAFTHMRTHFLDQYDWFLKADDDTYVIIENLKFLLSHFNPNGDVVVGDHFKHFSPTGYMSGGAGYVLSKGALRRLVDDGYSVPGRCRQAGGSEDIETGRCLDKVGVSKYVSLDRYNRSSFNALEPQAFGVNVSNFVRYYRVHGYTPGLECCSQLTISFHYIKPRDMVAVELLLYRISVFGRTQQYDKLMDMFSVRRSIIPSNLKRMSYPGETLGEYNNIETWKPKIYTKGNKKGVKNKIKKNKN